MMVLGKRAARLWRRTAQQVIVEDVTHDSESSTDDSHHADELIVEAERRVSMRSDVIDHFQASLESMVS